jgi:DNA-directed RNA polymerase subunit omega
MIEALKNDALVKRIGGAFRLTALVQRRLKELVEGSRPLIETTPEMTLVEIAVGEIMQEKIAIDYPHSDPLTLAEVAVQAGDRGRGSQQSTGALGGALGGDRGEQTGGMST